MWRISSGHMFSQPKLLSQRVRAVRRARGPKHVGKEDGGEDSLQAEKAVADTGVKGCRGERDPTSRPL